MIGALDTAASWAWSLLAGGIVHGTLLAAITGLLCATLLRRSRPALLAALWLIVLVKFAVPVGPEVPLSLDGATRSLLGSDGVAQPAVAVAHSESVSGADSTASAGSQGDASALGIGARLGLFALYLACVAAILRRRVRQHRTACALARSLPLAAPPLSARAAAMARALGLRRAPELRVDPGERTPQVVGVVRPVVVVPAWLATRPTALESVLVHELAHLRRRDTWIRSAQLVVGTLFFFWPVVAWVNRRVDCAREMACDQWAVLHGRLGPVGYARLLFSMARRSPGSPSARAATSVALFDRRPQLERRIDGLVAPGIGSGSLRPRMGLATGLAVGAWALVSLGGAARAHGGAAVELYPECVIDPNLVVHILEDYPEADADGDGVLTRAEICAHQALMKRRVVDDAFDSMDPGLARDVASWLDPTVDRDGDGFLSAPELETFKTSVATAMKPEDLGLDPVEFPGQVCEEAPDSCTASIEPAIR